MLDQAQRQRIFSGFWELANNDTQNAYLCGCVKLLPVKRHYTSNSRRGNTRVYYVHNGERSVRICKVAFLRLYSISSGRLTRLLANQAKHGGVPRLDARGYKEPPNKTSEEDLTFIRTHIESFPVYQSHYSRNDNPDRQYLTPDLSISKMHYLYKVKCEAEERRAVSDWVYRKVFNEEYKEGIPSLLFLSSCPLLTFTQCHTPPPYFLSVSHPFLPYMAKYTHPQTHSSSFSSLFPSLIHTHAHTQTPFVTWPHTLSLYRHPQTHSFPPFPLRFTNIPSLLCLSLPSYTIP